jgi:Glycosyl hydrolase family 12
MTGLRSAISMGSRVRRAILRPRFGITVAVLAAFALGAVLNRALVEPATRTSHGAPYPAMRIRHQLRPPLKPSFKSRHAFPPKRAYVFKPKPKPTPTTERRPTHPAPTASSSAPTPSPTTQAPSPTPVTSVRAGSVSCNYGPDTWSGDASKVGYSVKEKQASNGHLSSYTVVLNARKGNTEVVGYPSDQCLMYSALPANLTSSFDVTPPADSSGLDYEYAFDIWLTTAGAATKYNWDNDLELMIWTYVNGQVPIGSVRATLSDGSKVWISGDNKTGTVSVVLPKNETIGSVDIANIISQLKARGYINSADTGILDVEYGIEAPYGGGQTFEVNGFSVAAGS